MGESKLELFLEEMLKSSLFTNRTMVQKKDEKRKCLVIGMMLLDKKYISGFNYKDFSDISIREYCSWMEEHYSDRQKNTLRSAIEYLENAFPEERENISTDAIPILIYLADAAEYREIEPREFRKWWLSILP